MRLRLIVHHHTELVSWDSGYPVASPLLWPEDRPIPEGWVEVELALPLSHCPECKQRRRPVSDDSFSCGCGTYYVSNPKDEPASGDETLASRPEGG